VNATTTKSHRSLQSRHRKLTLKLQYLYAELDEHSEIFEEAKAEFGKAYQVYRGLLSEDEKKKLEAGEKKSSPPPKIDLPSIEADKKEVKKLFRDIATETHPDKLGHMADEEQEFRVGMFEKAKKACEELNWYELSKLAEELKIKIPSLSESQLHMLERTVLHVASQIDVMQHTYAWQWYKCAPEADREKFMTQYIQNMIQL
jgi:hypothetical protein